MKKIRLLLVHLLLVTMIASTISPVYVLADELTPAESAWETTEDAVDEAEADEAGEEDIEADDADIEADEAGEEDIEADDADTEADEDLVELLGEDPEADEETADDIGTLSLEEENPETDEFDDGSIKKPAVTDRRQITKITPPDKTEYSFEYKYSLNRLMENLPSKLTIWHEEDSNTIDIIWKCEEDYDKELDKYPFVPDLDGYTLAKDLEIPTITVRFEGDRPVYPSGCFPKDENSNMSIPVYEEEAGSTAAGLPKSYNGWKKGKLPKIRNQNPYGTCWSFATSACMEADLIHDKKANKNIDLSELHTAYYAGNFSDPKGLRKDSTSYSGGAAVWLDQGGWIESGGNLLSNLTGSVKETVAPYKKALSISSTLKNKKYVVSKDTYQLDRAYYFNPSDRNSIKKAIINHGAVMAGFSVWSNYYTKSGNCYYNPYNPSDGGHMITLVGWDDNFSRSKFGSYKPSGNGAWLVRNSWGYNGYDLDGYFWMSYYDNSLLNRCDYAVAFDAVKARYKNCYSYDGQTNWTWMYYATSPATQKTSFTVSAGEAVQAVGIVIGSDKVNATVTVKNKKTGKSSSGKLSCPYAGFYTVKLKSPVNVPNKAALDVTVKYTSSKGYVYVAAENSVNRYVGKIYYNTRSDKGFTLNGYRRSEDPRVKLYTVKAKAAKNVKVKKVKLNKSKLTLNKGKTFKLKATVTPKNATNKKVSWKSSKPKVATVNSSGKVTAKNPGTTTITATAKDGSKKKATCKVTVKKPKVKVKSVSLNYKTRTLKKGKTLNLKATVKPKNATNKKVKWTSSKPKVATVNSKGKVTAKSPGKAKITATAKDGSKKKAACTITVKKK